VKQSSFDIEQFCHEVAQVMCGDAGMQYWFCSDYDVEIVDVRSSEHFSVMLTVLIQNNFRCVPTLVM
jgi:hypothetical protein